jgi:selenocysteine-specific elongation factor
VRVVATAGHVDHGKSTLVRALTGTDPDRFPEEKARGLTIDLGFAFFDLPSGQTVGFVDVPGHVKFVKNMLAGAGAVDVALVVVAANEGWMPQTEEHVRILELLGVEHGMIALTKASLVDDDTLELARLELDEHTAHTTLEHFPVVVVDALDGRGLAELVTTLDDVLAAAPPPRDDGRPRLWVDRVFAARGAGTVVTGTLTHGRVAVDDELVVVPGEQRVRVRGIQSHHERLPSAQPGSRVALNLAGIEHHALARGDALVAPDAWPHVDVVDVAVLMLGGEELAKRSALDVHVGSGQHHATVRTLDADGRYARVRFDRPLPLAPDDQLVLRSSARQTTIGGAVVLDVAPAPRVADAVNRLRRPFAQRLLATTPWLRTDDAIALGASPAHTDAIVHELVAENLATMVEDWVVADDELARVVQGAVDLVDAHHRAHPADAGADIAALAQSLHVERAQLRVALATADALVVERDVVRRPDHRSGAEQDDGRRLRDALESAPFAPPAPADLGIDGAVVRALVRDGVAVDLDGVVFAASALVAARNAVSTALQERGELTIADIRDVLGSTRKYVMPLVNRLDAEGVTRRRGDVRIAGPRAGREE